MIAPKIAVLFTSYRCNSRCTMCSAWIKQREHPELSLAQIEKIFSNKVLKRSIEILNLTGGEPTLREDMVEIIKVIINNCKRLYRIDIPTNAINTTQVVDKVERTLAILLIDNIKLTVTVSIDGVGKMHEKVRGMNDIFLKVDKTIRELKELSELYPSLSVSLNTTVSAVNIDGLADVYAYARSCGVGINFTLAAISEIGVESISMRHKFNLPAEDKKRLIGFFRKLVDENAINQDYGDFIINWLNTGRRSVGCNFRKGTAFLLEPDGEAYLCGNFKEFRVGNLLDETFEEIWRRSALIPREALDRCLSCNSNCYLEL